jgi:hypothetical protein
LTTAACWLIRTSSPFRPRPKIAGCSEAGTGCNAAGDRGNRGGWRRPGEHPGVIGARWPHSTTSGARRRPGSTSRPIALGRSPSPSTTVGHVAMWTGARTENTPFYLRVSLRLLSSCVHGGEIGEESRSLSPVSSPRRRCAFRRRRQVRNRDAEECACPGCRCEVHAVFPSPQRILFRLRSDRRSRRGDVRQRPSTGRRRTSATIPWAS